MSIVGLLFVNLGPGTRTAGHLLGDCVDEREIRGNCTIGVSLLLLRFLWQMHGVATFEHPLTSLVWKLRAISSLLGHVGIHKCKIHQCAFGLRPGDDCTRRYFKPTGILTIGARCFAGRTYSRQHLHAQIIGSYSKVIDGSKVVVQRSHEAGAYPAQLCRSFADVHCRPLL